MFDQIVFQTADLKWLVPMVIGAIALLGCIVALIRNDFGWTLTVVAVLAVALIGASVFTKISVTKEGVIVETAQMSIQSLTELQKAAKANSDAITKLAVRVDQLASVSQKIATTQPGSATHSEELGQISKDAKAIQGDAKVTNDLLVGVGKNNDLLKMQLEKLRF